MDDLLRQLVEQKMGAQGGAPQQAGAPQAAQTPAAPPAPPKASDKPTQQEQGAAKVAPTAADSEPSFEMIEFDHGGERRQMTSQQLGSTLDRYRDLNHKWQSEVTPMKPVMEVLKQLMGSAKANGHEANPAELAELVQAAVKAYISNPQMGGDSKKANGKAGAPMAAMGDSDADESGGPSDGDGDEAMSAWEKQNAVKLPPGYKAQSQAVKGLSSKLDQLLQLMQSGAGPAAQGAQALEAAKAQGQQAQGAAVSASKMAVMNNIKSAMQGAQMTPADIQDFQAFSMARGYSPEDFIDPELAQTVVSDFAANRQAPEIGRLREIAQRRQAFTGSVGGAPGGAGAPSQAPADPMFAGMLSSAMGNRNM